MRYLPPLHQLEGLAKGLTIIVTGPTRSAPIKACFASSSHLLD